MEFLQHKMEFFSFFQTKGRKVVVNKIMGDVCEAKDEKIGALNDGFESWDLLCL